MFFQQQAIDAARQQPGTALPVNFCFNGHFPLIRLGALGLQQFVAFLPLLGTGGAFGTQYYIAATAAEMGQLFNGNAKGPRLSHRLLRPS